LQQQGGDNLVGYIVLRVIEKFGDAFLNDLIRSQVNIPMLKLIIRVKHQKAIGKKNGPLSPYSDLSRS
jgi:hypothetical protein